MGYKDNSRPVEKLQRAIPANVEAERAVLGSILLNPDAIGEIADMLTPADFFREVHAWIYESMLKLHADHKTIDTVTLEEALSQRGLLVECGGRAYLTECAMAVPTALYGSHYAGIVKEASQRRGLITIAGEIAKAAYDEETPITESVDAAERRIFALAQSSTVKEFTPARDHIDSLLKRIDHLSRHKGQTMGVPSGFAMLDKILGGFQKSDLIILAARPGMGKSALALNIARNAMLRHNQRIGIVSLEMSTDQYLQRLLSLETTIDSHRLRLGDIKDGDWFFLQEGAERIRNYPLYIDDTSAQNMADLRSKCRRLHSKHGIDMLIVDYLHLIKGPKAENRHLQLGIVTKELKALAREIDIPLLVLSQLSRALENRSDKRPMLSDLRESGSIEEDADAVLFIHRDDYYNSESDRAGIADIIIAKHRHGETGTVSLFFRKEQTQFRDMEIQRTDFEY